MACPRVRTILMVASAMWICGCAHGPQVLPESQQIAIDRRSMEYPPGFVVKPFMVGLTAPTAMCIDSDGTLFVAEGGGTIDGIDPHIFGYKPGAPEGHQFFNVYPSGPQIPFVRTGFRIFGPIGGMVAVNGKLFVTHQDANGYGAVTAFGYDGSHTPVVSDLPACGDYKMGDICVDDAGRLYFSVGAATNSGVVGLDNWEDGWVRDHPDFCDATYEPLKLQGYRFNSNNPLAGLFSGADIAVTGPFQPFNISDETRIPGNRKPTGAIYSISQTGGDLHVEAWGIRDARGIVCGDFHRIYFTDDGMEPRGTRPVLYDPDAVFQLVSRGNVGTWYGWPDYSRDLEIVDADKYQPPQVLLRGTGYHEISALIDEQITQLAVPDKLNWLKGTFEPQAGAAKLAIVPSTGPFHEYRGGLIVAMDGDRAPFSNGGPEGPTLTKPTGYKLVRVDLLTKQSSDFIYNVKDGPASWHGQSGHALERPIDVKFSSNGMMYILDYGQMVVKHGQPQVTRGSGIIWRVMPAN
jgi:glucose/arabinose dehydrogenase